MAAPSVAYNMVTVVGAGGVGTAGGIGNGPVMAAACTARRAATMICSTCAACGMAIGTSAGKACAASGELMDPVPVVTCSACRAMATSRTTAKGTTNTDIIDDGKKEDGQQTGNVGLAHKNGLVQGNKTTGRSKPTTHGTYPPPSCHCSRRYSSRGHTCCRICLPSPFFHLSQSGHVVDTTHDAV